MGYRLNFAVSSEDISRAFDLEHMGKVIEILEVGMLGDKAKSLLCFSNTATIPEVPGTVLISSPENCHALDPDAYALIASNSPRLDFIRVLDWLERNVGFDSWDQPANIHPTSVIGQNVVIEPGCIIEEDVIIEHNVVIHSGTRVGRGSRIRSCSSIGGDGFGFERLPNGRPIRFPHLGGVVIGEYVEIGALNSVVRGTLEDTLIGSHTKTDNLVHIAHNCKIGEGVLITACAELSGGVRVGNDAWIGPNSSFMQKVTIGNGCLVGLGAVVTKSIPDKVVVAGNPAKKIRNIQ